MSTREALKVDVVLIMHLLLTLNIIHTTSSISIADFEQEKVYWDSFF